MLYRASDKIRVRAEKGNTLCDLFLMRKGGGGWGRHETWCKTYLVFYFLTFSCNEHEICT